MQGHVQGALRLINNWICNYQICGNEGPYNDLENCGYWRDLNMNNLLCWNKLIPISPCSVRVMMCPLAKIFACPQSRSLWHAISRELQVNFTIALGYPTQPTSVGTQTNAYTCDSSSLEASCHPRAMIRFLLQGWLPKHHGEGWGTPS